MTARRTTRTRLWAIAPTVVAVTLSLSACGGDDEKGDGGPAEPATPADLVVTGVEGLKWDAESYIATAGDVDVLLRNESSLPHNLVIVAEDGAQQNGEIVTKSKNDEATGTYTLTAGTYTIICTVPGHTNMKADLTVS